MIATVVATVVAFAMLPIFPAAAQANATARLVNNAVVYPGSYTYTLAVTNNEPVGTFGIGAGRTIRWIRVELPNAAGIDLGSGTPTAGNFTTVDTRRVGGTTDWVTFSGGTLAPGATVNINIPAVAGAPSNCDVTGTWRIRVSSDENGAESIAPTPTSPGALTARIQVLELVSNSLKPVEPFDPSTNRGVRNNTGTGGQLITYEYQVKNHATNQQNVSGQMTSSQGADVPAPAQSKLIDGLGQTATFLHDIQLGDAAAQRTTSFIAKASTGCANATDLTNNFTVQVPVNLEFTNLAPLRVRSGLNSSKTFTATALKTGGPQFELRSGNLSFGGNDAALVNPPRIFNAGSHSLTVQYFTEAIQGTQGPKAASITSIGEDFNLAPVNLVRNVDPITIDLTAPLVNIDTVTLPLDADGDRQTAVKNGDTVTASGRVTGQVKANGQHDLVGCPVVQIIPNAGATRNMSVTCSNTPDNTGVTWTATASNTQWDAQALYFLVTAAQRDEADNEGTATTQSTFLVDLVRPALGGYANQFPGTVVSSHRISVRFEDNLGALRGGCDPSAWLVDGVAQVENVYLGTGHLCSGSTLQANDARRSLSDGVRILELRQQFGKAPHDEPTVTYLRSDNDRIIGRYPGKDGASLDALQKSIQTLNQVIPPMPAVDLVQRRTGPNDSYVDAYFDAEEAAYYTRVAGPDGVRSSWSFTTPVTVSVTPPNYRVRVTDAAGNVLQEVPAQDQNLISGQWTGTIAVPLPQDADGKPIDGTYVRRLHVVSPSGVLSQANALTIVVDTVRPTLATSVFDATNTITVKFTEKIVSGANFGSDWVIGYEVVNASGSRVFYTSAETVTGIDQLTRRLVVTDLPTPDAYRSTDYMLSSTGARYQDRAGNLMGDTISFQ